MSQPKEENQILALRRQNDRLLKILLTKIDKSDYLETWCNQLQDRIEQIEQLIGQAQTSPKRRKLQESPNQIDESTIAKE